MQPTKKNTTSKKQLSVRLAVPVMLKRKKRENLIFYSELIVVLQ